MTSTLSTGTSPSCHVTKHSVELNEVLILISSDMTSLRVMILEIVIEMEISRERQRQRTMDILLEVLMDMLEISTEMMEILVEMLKILIAMLMKKEEVHGPGDFGFVLPPVASHQHGPHPSTSSQMIFRIWASCHPNMGIMSPQSGQHASHQVVSVT
jgi:hypothetical protein